MREHTITNMRDHLLALQAIDDALSRNDFDNASRVAEQRLGMSSLELHGATHIAPYMPQRMRDLGTQMHRSASRFAVEAQNASVSNDVRPALAALSTMLCHLGRSLSPSAKRDHSPNGFYHPKGPRSLKKPVD